MNRTRQLSSPFIISLLLSVSLICWVFSEIIGGKDGVDVLTVCALACGIAFVALFLHVSNRKKMRSLRTIAFSKNSGFCPGYGQFAYDGAIDFIEESLLANVNATYANKTVSAPLDLSAEYVLKTGTLMFSILQRTDQVADNRGQAASLADPSDIGNIISKVTEAAFVSLPASPMTNSADIAVSIWNGTIECVSNGQRWRFSDLNELEDLLQRIL